MRRGQDSAEGRLFFGQNPDDRINHLGWIILVFQLARRPVLHQALTLAPSLVLRLHARVVETCAIGAGIYGRDLNAIGLQLFAHGQAKAFDREF